MMERFGRFAVALVRALVWLYPPAYRRGVGAEIVEDFREQWTDHAARGWRAATRVLVRSLLDVIACAAAEWLLPVQRGGLRTHHGARERGSRFRLVDSLRGDIRLGFRQVVRRPGFSGVIILMVALGVGANTVIFSAVDRLLLRPLPLGEPDRLMAVWETNVEKGWTREPVAPANLFDWRARVAAFADVTAYGAGVATVGGGEGVAEAVPAAFVMGNFFAVVAVRAAHGRTFHEGETWSDAAPAVVLSDGLWARRFGRDPGVIGSLITVDEVERRVVGVMPRGFDFPVRGAELWLPMGWDRSSPERAWFRSERFLLAIARLRAADSIERARAQLGAAALALQEEHPATDAGVGTGLTPLGDFLSAESRAPLMILLGASVLILLLACANVANLLLVRASARGGEMAVRAALGAGQARLARQALVESMILAGLGCAAGLGIAAAGIRVLRWVRPPEALQVEGLSIDARVLTFSLVITLATGLLFGLAPALRGAAGAASALASGARHTAGRASRRTTRSLVVAQLALALLLAVSAGLLLRSFLALRSVDPGFAIEDRVTASIVLTARYDSDARILGFVDELVARLGRLNGVEAVTYATRLPFGGNTTHAYSLWIEGRGPERIGEQAGARIVAANYFDVMRVPLLRGRTFDAADRVGAERVLVINERMARRLFPDEDPVGRRITWAESVSDNTSWYRIIGVVGDEHQNGLHAQPPMEAFHSFRQLPGTRVRLILHTGTDAGAVAGLIRTELAAVDDRLALADVQSVETMHAALLGRDRLLLALIGAYAVLALLLATVGVYGLMARTVAQRTREIGIRLALGAAPAGVAAQFLAHGLALAGTGIGLGLAAAVATTRLLRAVLFGVAPTDGLTFIIVMTTLLLAVALACTIPALRAARLQPDRVLRQE
ncbi:MAG: ABC transporter permease [Gemmatimonadetes bacterium]|nr:ABC transporter permease [Gemmatimonadota bacterium]